MKYRIIVSLFILAFLYFVFYFSKPTQNSYTSNCIELIKAKKIEKNNYFGIVSNQHDIDLSFRSEGKITYLPFTKGDYIKKGQIIGKIDAELYKIEQKEEENKFLESKVKLQHAKNYYKRMDMLHNEGAISDNDWEDAYFDLKTKEKEIVVQKEKVNYANRQIAYSTLKSYVDGIVTEKLQEVGEYARVGIPVIRISANLVNRIEFSVNSSDINKIKLNSKAIILRKNKEYFGKITHISANSLEDGGYIVKIDLDKKYPELKTGMTVEIKTQNNEDLYKIPLECVFDNNKIIIFDKNNFKSISINFNNSDDKFVYIENFKFKNNFILKNPKNINYSGKICEKLSY